MSLTLSLRQVFESLRSLSAPMRGATARFGPMTSRLGLIATRIGPMASQLGPTTNAHFRPLIARLTPLLQSLLQGEMQTQTSSRASTIPCPPTPLVRGPCVVFSKPHSPLPLHLLDRQTFRFPLRVRHVSPGVLVVDTDTAGAQAIQNFPHVLRIEQQYPH